MERRVKNSITLRLDNHERILNNSSLKRYSGRLNLNQKAFDGRVKIAYTFIGAQKQNVRPDQGSMVVDMLRLNPTISARTNGQPTLIDDILSPLARQQLYTDEATNNRIIANISPSIEFFKGLTYKMNLGVDFSSTDRVVQTVPYALLEGLDFGSLNSIYYKNSNSLIENTLNYVFDKDKHSMNFLAGHSFQEFFENRSSFGLTGFANNDIEPRYQDQFSTQEQPTTLNTYAIKNELQSFFGRVNYGFASKYLVTATFSADGSSKFGTNNRYGYFPSFAAGWNITNEDFMSGTAFTNLKLRASWGQTGN